MLATHFVETARLKIHFVTHAQNKLEDFKIDKHRRILFLVHGNFSSSFFYEDFIAKYIPQDKCIAIAMDLREYGKSESKLIDATKGYSDFAQDLYSLLDALFADNKRPIDLLGWSLGGGVVMQFLMEYPQYVRSLILESTISPFGVGGTKDEDGNLCYEDATGSGAGVVNAAFVKRVAVKDYTDNDQDNTAPLTVFRKFIVRPPFKPYNELQLLQHSFLQQTHEKSYPGDFESSDKWPFVKPGKFGPINASSPKHLKLKDMITKIVNYKNENYQYEAPRILWIYGQDDAIVSDHATLDMGFLGELGVFGAAYPGKDVFPAQPQWKQIRKFLTAYANACKTEFKEVKYENCGHSPQVEEEQTFAKDVLQFLQL